MRRPDSEAAAASARRSRPVLAFEAFDGFIVPRVDGADETGYLSGVLSLSAHLGHKY
jgi:hypothetical protein